MHPPSISIGTLSLLLLSLDMCFAISHAISRAWNQHWGAQCCWEINLRVRSFETCTILSTLFWFWFFGSVSACCIFSFLRIFFTILLAISLAFLDWRINGLPVSARSSSFARCAWLHLWIRCGCDFYLIFLRRIVGNKNSLFQTLCLSTLFPCIFPRDSLVAQHTKSFLPIFP